MDIQQIRELTLGKYEANKALMLKKLFGEIWHTDLEVVTDEDGYAEFKGFYGDYEAKVNGETASFGIHKTETNSHHLVFYVLFSFCWHQLVR